MNFVKKILILTIVFSIVHVNVFASHNQEKEKKTLIKFIKTEYDSWKLSHVDYSDSASTVLLCLGETMKEPGPNTRAKLETTQTASKKHDFQFVNSKFTIAGNQAVVEFIADDQKFSAFFEKTDDKWKLICAAPLDSQM